MSHNYHPMCGCYSCGKQELAAEREDELCEQLRDDLMALPSYIADFDELAVDDEAAAKVATAVKDGDLAEVGRIFVTVLQRRADQDIEERADQQRIPKSEAAEQLINIHSPDDRR